MAKNDGDVTDRGERGRKLSQLLVGSPDPAEWYGELETAHPRDIIAAIGGLGCSGAQGAQYEAYRDAARSMIEVKLTDAMVTQMAALERVTTRLAIVATGVGVVGAIATVAGVVIAL